MAIGHYERIAFQRHRLVYIGCHDGHAGCRFTGFIGRYRVDTATSPQRRVGEGTTARDRQRYHGVTKINEEMACHWREWSENTLLAEIHWYVMRYHGAACATRHCCHMSRAGNIAGCYMR